MTKAELFDLISRFAQRPLPALAGRHVYLWHGPLSVLKEAVPTELLVSTIDLRHLAATLPRAPRAHDEARRLMVQIIQKSLNEQLEAAGQQIFLITGCDLLSRYHVSLNPFFQVASEKRMVILVVPLSETQFQPSSPLPGYVELNAATPFEYLYAAVGSTATISANS